MFCYPDRCVCHLPGNRTIDVSYRNGVIKNVSVSSLHSEVGVRFWAAVKTAAIRQKLIDPMLAKRMVLIAWRLWLPSWSFR